MTGDELKAAAVEMYGDRKWATALAAALQRERTQIWRYAKSERVPTVVELAMRQLLSGKGTNV